VHDANYFPQSSNNAGQEVAQGIEEEVIHQKCLGMAPAL